MRADCGHPIGNAIPLVSPAGETKRDMSVSDQTLQGDDASTPLSLSEAVFTVLVGCVAVDGVLKAEEASRLKEVLSSTRWALGTGVKAAGVMTRAVTLISEQGLPAVLGACAKAIPAELHATTFALALDLVLADGRLGDRENAVVDKLQSALQIDADLARRVVDVLLIKNRASGRPDL